MKTLIGMVAAFGAALSISSAVVAGGYKKDLIDTATNAGGFNTLVAAIDAAELNDTLKGDGPFTVFAPSDEALVALPEGAVDDLLKPEEREKLVEQLTYHVVPGKVMSMGISNDKGSVENLAGSELTVDQSNGVMVNAFSITETDIKAYKGVIHLINKVIMPSSGGRLA